ncbi:MAG: CotH kinase family protein, partial [Caldilineaceae bacterium]|nr:CotH kinase family protein [Caldilineaceae bacterium]
GRSVSLDKADVGDGWPLIRYLLDDPVYHAAYVSYVEQVSTDLFTPEKMAAKAQALAGLLAPYVAEEIGAEEYAQAVEQLLDFVETRAGAVAEFLAQ